MRTAALTVICFVAFGLAAKSQRFTLLPQVGFENSKTNVTYNDLSSFSPIGVKFSPHASLRLNYSSKQGHGFYVGVASSQSTVTVSFSDLEKLASNYAATAGSMQLRLEGGYQYSFKPISLGKSKQSSTSKSTTTTSHSSSSYGGCCHKSYSCCRHSSGNEKEKQQPATTKTKGSWVRIQPSVGMGYIPWVKTDVVSNIQNGQTVYEYRAGNWNTAVMAGAGFEFGKNAARLFTVSVNYFKGLGNLGTQTITSQSAGKTVTADLKSSVSGWNMKVGIPFTLGKSPAAKHKKTQTPQYHGGCGQYRIMYRCGNK